MSTLTNFFSNLQFLAPLSLILAFLSSIRMYPVIIYIVRSKNMMDEPGGRKIHSTQIPTLGGVGMFASFSVALIVFGIFIGLGETDLVKLLSILASTLMLLFLGVKDDLVSISPRKKLVGQLFAACIIIFLSDVRLSNFHGLLGIWELPYIASVLITLFGFVLTTNAFNLCDGIDGLAGSIALIGCCTFGFFFVQNDQALMSLTSFILIGSTLGFLRYNLSDTKKLFMGDSGSMFMGFLLFYQGVSFLEMNESAIPLQSINAIIILLAILSFPLLDTLRVFVIRAWEKRSPFSPDRNHIHHRLINLGLTHKQSTLLIVSCNWFVIGAAFFVQDLDSNVQLLVVMGISVTLYLFPFTSFAQKLIALTRETTPHPEASISHPTEIGASKAKNSSTVLKPQLNNAADDKKKQPTKTKTIYENPVDSHTTGHTKEDLTLKSTTIKGKKGNESAGGAISKIQNVLNKRMEALKHLSSAADDSDKQEDVDEFE
ncbi:MAG: MraY family glycosyltransferase, partial [Bacteroidota bacterium]